MSNSAFGFYGAFGSAAYADPDRALAVGFVCRQARGLPMLKLAPSIAKTVDAIR
jgi:hypothetical protein